MYYPGLFESANPYSALSSRPAFGKADSAPPVEQHASESLGSLLDSKKMVSNLSTSLAGSSLTSPFRSAHFPTTHIMSSPYVSPSATHLPGSENLGTSLLHEQSFLEASTPYGIGSLSSYSHYPSYLGNSVINSAMKAPSGSTYPTHNSFYPHNSTPYPALYSDSFISDYITRNHIDANQAAYNSTSDNSSFTEHLKRLQESFQSKSPKTADNANQHQSPRSSSHHPPNQGSFGSTQPVRPEPILLQPCASVSKSSVINQHHHSTADAASVSRSNTSTVSGLPTTSAPRPSSSRTCASTTDCEAPNSTSCQPKNSTNSSRSKGASSVKEASRQQQLPDGNQCIVPSADKSSIKGSKGHPSDRHIDDSIEQTIESCIAGFDLSSVAASNDQSPTTDLTNSHSKAADGDEQKRVTASKLKNKQAQAKLKRNRSVECGQREETGQEKIAKKQCKHQLLHPENEKNKRERPSKSKKPLAKEAKSEKSRSRKKKPAAVSTKEASKKVSNDLAKQSTKESGVKEQDAEKKLKESVEETPSEAVKESTKEDANEKPKSDSVNDVKANNSSKKASSNARRRRFRSGLDMIRSSRKKAPAKPKVVANCSKKEKTKKKDPTMKDLRLESKRLMVNKSLGETLLHRSARNNRMDVVKFCLESDACDVNARDNAGYTPLHECSSRGNLEVARLLLEHSANVNASAIGGIRPLHDAIENNHIELARLLLSYGADPNISTYSGSTPLQLCRSKMMFKFLKGFYSDIGTERPVIDSTTLAWKFRHEQLANGFDVFADVPSDDEECDMEFLSSESPLVPSYRLMHNVNSPFYLLFDVLQATEMNQTDLLLKHPQVQISKVSKADYAKATLSQLEQRTTAGTDDRQEQEEVSVIYRDDAIDQILHISSTVIR